MSFKDARAFDHGRDTHHLDSGPTNRMQKYVIGEMCKRGSHFPV